MSQLEPTISRLIRVIGAGIEPFGALAIVPWHQLADLPLRPGARGGTMLRRLHETFDRQSPNRSTP
jgi:hypothetical protein